MLYRLGTVAASARLLLVGASLSAGGQTFSVLHEFSNGADGAFPYASLVQDSTGNLYGTTGGGGGTGCDGLGCGTVFEIAPDGMETIIYAFQGANDGASPATGLAMDGSGDLYGATAVGGNPHCVYSEKPYGCGTVFKVTPEGAETTLYVFAGGKDGSEPEGPLAMNLSGDLFGTTIEGGVVGKKGRDECGERRGCGTVFEIAADGTKTVLHAFGGGKDGSVPIGGVVQDGAGNLYGATNEGGGGAACEWGCGAVYKISPDGKESILYRFQGGGDGESPGSLIINAAGDLFGATIYGGGTTCKCGTIFRVTSRGHEKVLYAFKGGSDGVFPNFAPLAMDGAGNLYGTTAAGGEVDCTDGCGAIFELSSDNKETVLYAFSGGPGGEEPIGGVILDSSGDVFGTTHSGGNTSCPGSDGNGCGIVFQLTN